MREGGARRRARGRPVQSHAPPLLTRSVTAALASWLPSFMAETAPVVRAMVEGGEEGEREGEGWRCLRL